MGGRGARVHDNRVVANPAISAIAEMAFAFLMDTPHKKELPTTSMARASDLSTRCKFGKQAMHVKDVPFNESLLPHGQQSEIW